MKIFYYFPEYETNMFRWQRTHIIDELQLHNVEFDTFNPLLFSSPDEANQECIKKIKGGDYDVFISSVCNENIIFPETIETVKNKGIPTLTIRWDNLTIPFNDKNMAPHFDLVWLTSIETKWLYDKWGVKSIFLPYAANPRTFTYHLKHLERRSCFIGTPYGSRSIMINTLTSSGLPVDLFYGKNKERDNNKNNQICVKYEIPQKSSFSLNFDRFKYKEGRKIILGGLKNKFIGQTKIKENSYLTRYPSVPEISSYYSDYALSLASTSTNHTDSLRNPLKIINLRNFEIPMSGGIEVCKYNPELAEYFEENKEIVFYKTNEELVEKVRYYTQEASDNLLFKMKKAARMRAESEHTWWCRFSMAFNKLGIKY